jgi:prolyl-tRNA synthetase
MAGKKSETLEKRLIPKANFTEWFDNVLLEAKIADDRYPVKGFTVYTGWGFSIAKRIINLLEEELDKKEHEPMQFPVVIPEDSFQKEADHIEGFGNEVFWITKAGDNQLERKLLLRPTSETAIYPMFKLWIRSHQDLPLLMHQTCNVYRYETKATRPLYRGREFLWNEAHTAHIDFNDSERQVKDAIEAYRNVYDGLGISYLMLKRPDFDKFAGAVYSVAFDTWNPDGKVNQIGTVHQLGENFAKAFDLKYEDETGEQKYCSNTCYGMGFGRTLAATISHHGDEHGLILPPLVAPKQVVIVPILFKGKEESTINYCKQIHSLLNDAGIRVVLDDNERTRPGEKFYKWEMFGVPLRIEIGPREVDKKTVTLVRRDTFKKMQVEYQFLQTYIKDLFVEIFKTLKEKSWKKLENEIRDAYTIDELEKYMDQRKIVRVNWCGEPECASIIKDQVAGEIRGTKWDMPEHSTEKCITCKEDGKYVAYVSRTY